MKKRDNCKWADVVKEMYPLKLESLKKYERFWKFVKEYPRFLRVQIGYSALLKYATKFDAYFKTHDEQARIWKNVDN